MVNAIPIFLAISIMPGLCTTLAMTLGITIGVRRTVRMVIGELAGVALIATCSILGAAAVMMSCPVLYGAAKIAGAVYLIYVGTRLFAASRRAAAIDHASSETADRRLLWRGFLVAISNPKPWILYASLLPSLIVYSRAIAPQMLALLSVILSIELACMLLYALGGRALSMLLNRTDVVRFVNISGGLIITGLACTLLLFD